ncbi:MAG TPA: molybdopterin molybdotransferase MoeA [Puia sp.]|jgi:molybdopterin molybdotransferase|nr:molybdopterin molybdotransferase MoeA [Puia sp.]
MIDYRRAREIVLSQARSFGREELRLEQAFGRVLSETIRSDRDYPPFPRATMDGYALRAADLERGIRKFRIVGAIYAGGLPDRSIGPGDCYRIMTGGAVPASADTVIRREDVSEGGESIELSAASWHPFQYIAAQGEDLAAGDPVIDSPCLCDPSIIGLLATLGRTRVVVERLPRVGLLTTGNEVVSVDAPVGPVEIRNTNRWFLEAALRKGGIIPAACTHAQDDPVLLRAALESMLDNDLLILCGGVSAGDADHVPAVLEAVGSTKLFHKIAMRPGKPTWCGLGPGGKMIFALPGNPFSTFVNMTLLVHPFLQACYGLRPSEPWSVPLGAPRKKRTPLDEFFPVHVHGSPVRADAVSLNSSGDIRLGRGANALGLHPADSGDLAEGAGVGCYSLV